MNKISRIKIRLYSTVSWKVIKNFIIVKIVTIIYKDNFIDLSQGIDFAPSSILMFFIILFLLFIF